MENSQLESLNGGIITQIEELKIEQDFLLSLIEKAQSTLKKIPQVIETEALISKYESKLTTASLKEQKLRETAK